MTIRRFLLLLTLSLATSKVSFCQSTSVSGTIVDAGGQAWIGGTYTFTTAALGQVPITGTLDSSGAFTSLTFPHNSFTSAVGDVWTARICPDATAPCYTKTVTISGATQSLSSTLIPAAISLTIPAYPGPVSYVRAYADAEIISTPKGGYYYNTTTSSLRVCTTVSGNTCTVWAGVAAGSGLPTLPTTPNNVAQVPTSTPVAGVGGDTAWSLPGLVGRDITGTTATDTIASTDCSPKGIFYQGSVAVAVTLPTATTLGVPNCVFTLTNNTSGSSTAVTVTPTTWTVAPGGASLAIAQGRSCRFTVDSAVATQWDADCHDLPIVAGSNITITRGQYGPTVASSGGVSGLSTNTIPKAASSTSLADSSIADDGTTVSTKESLSIGTAAPACTAGTSGGMCFTEGTDLTNVAGSLGIDANSTQHELVAYTNGSALQGMLVRTQPGRIHSTGNTAAITTATLCASAAGACNTAGLYTVDWSFTQGGTACGTPGTGGVTFLLTWTDANALAHSAISLAMDDSASLVATTGTFNFRTTNAAAWASGTFNIYTNGSIIQYATGYTACGVGTGTYNLDITVTRKGQT